MDLVLGRGAFQRDRGAFVPWRQVNCMLEPVPTDERQFNLLSRPPLINDFEVGAGPVEGIFQRDGLFDGDTFTVSAGVLYRNLTSLGAIDGTGAVSWAGGNNELVVTRGAHAYSYDGTDLEEIVFPDDASVRAVHWMAGWFFYIRDESGRFYWSELNDGRTIGDLSFATAESSQDNLLDIKKVGDLFWMLGAASGEAWVLTGDPDIPLTRVVQRTLERGVRNTGCAEEIENTVYFISNDGMVCRIEEAAVRVSEAGLEERIRKSTTASAFQFQYEGKVLFVLRLDSGTFALDLALQHQPIELATNGRANWAPMCAANIGAEAYFGDDTDGIVWKFGENDSTDCGETVFERRWSAGLPVQTQPLSISNVVVRGNSGDTDVLDPTNIAFDPKMEMRFSTNGGRSFSTWRATRWGKSGEYWRRARFGPCGMFEAPGFLGEFRVQACVPLRISSAQINEPLSGRGH